MKNKIRFFVLMLMTGFVMSCSETVYSTNGESIYRNGKNLQGRKMLDKEHSEITFMKSCEGCHGKNGERIKRCNVRWEHLSNAAEMKVPYTEELFFRFLDKDLKSDGTAARTGVHWKMSREEKLQLIEYLKVLK